MENIIKSIEICKENTSDNIVILLDKGINTAIEQIKSLNLKTKKSYSEYTEIDLKILEILFTQLEGEQIILRFKHPDIDSEVYINIIENNKEKRIKLSDLYTLAVMNGILNNTLEYITAYNNTEMIIVYTVSRILFYFNPKKKQTHGE